MTLCCAILLYLILFTPSGLNHDLTIFHAAMAVKNKARVSKYVKETVFLNTNWNENCSKKISDIHILKKLINQVKYGSCHLMTAFYTN